MDILSVRHSRFTRRPHGAVGAGTRYESGSQIQDRTQSAAVSSGLLEISFHHRTVRDWEFEQFVPDTANQGFGRILGNDDSGLCGVQPSRAALISYPAGFLSDRLGRKTVLLGSFVIFFIAYAGFALTQQVVWVAAMFVFYGLYQGIFRSVGKAFASDFVPDQLRASAVGWYSATVGLLQLVARVVAGLLWDHVGHAAVFAYGAAFALAGIIALSLFQPGQAPGGSHKT